MHATSSFLSLKIKQHRRHEMPTRLPYVSILTTRIRVSAANRMVHDNSASEDDENMVNSGTSKSQAEELVRRVIES